MTSVIGAVPDSMMEFNEGERTVVPSVGGDRTARKWDGYSISLHSGQRLRSGTTVICSRQRL